MINFKPVTAEDRVLYEKYLRDGKERGCEYSFANRYLWGEHSMAVIHGYIVMLARFGEHTVYPYPIGKGDIKPVLDEIIADSKERGIKCMLGGLVEEDKREMQALYPERFRFFSDIGRNDYVYTAEDLAFLKGRKYHAKRNHCHRFEELYPNWSVAPITDKNIDTVGVLASEWFENKSLLYGAEDYGPEKAALEKALSALDVLGMEGILLSDGEKILAFTVGSFISEDTVDIHFEKSHPDAEGAYAVINREFARYILEKYPSVRFLNREEDMGIEGLRKAKSSYKPHHMVEKYRAVLLNTENESN